MILSCFIIDYEPLALQLLKSYVEKTPFLQLTGQFSSAIAATSAVTQTPPDVLFLDIQMAELSGMEFAKLVPKNSRIIFTTAFQQYALDSYKVNALDYLLKPFSYSEFLQAANKAVEWHQINEKVATDFEKPSNDSIFVKADYRLIQVQLQNILYIEGLKDYQKIYLENEPQPIISHVTMRALEEMLPPQQFLRIHRSFIVQISKIKVIERNCVVFGKTYIPVSDSYKDVFQEFLKSQKMV